MDETVASADAKVDDFAGKSGTARLSVDDSGVDETVASADAKVDEFGAKDEKARVGVDDGDSNPVLDEIIAKLDEINGKTATAHVNIDSSGGGGLSSLFSGGLTSPASIAGIGLGSGALLPALPGALTGAGAAAGTLGLAIAGVSKALSDYSTQQNSASSATGKSAASQVSAANTIRTAQQAVSQAETQQAHDAVTSAEAIKNAQQGVAQAQTQAAHDAVTSAESIKNAQQGVASATQQAAQNQISAEEQLKNAQYAEQQAQISLTQARQQAILTLQSLTNASQDAALSVSQDQLNVQQAEQNQATVDANSKSTMLQREQAALSVKEAEQALKEAIQNRTNSAKAAQTADKQGVAGNPAVLAAEHAQQQAKQGVADAQRNLANTEKAGAQAIAKAEQSLADAIRSASWQRVADAQNVAKAQQSLADTSRNASWTQQADAKNVSNAQAGLKAAYASAGTAAGKTSTATKQYAKDMAALTPAGRGFVNAITGMMGALHSLEGVSEKALLPGLTGFLKGVKSLGPEISKEVASMGGILSKGFSAIGKELQSSGFQQELRQLFTEGNRFMEILGPAVGKLGLAFLKMGAQSGPAVTGLAKGLSAILGGVGKLFTTLGKFSGSAGSILETLGKAVGALGGPLGTVIGTINSALAPLLKGMLPAFRQILQAIAGAVVAAGPGLIAFANSIAELMPALTPLISMLSGGLAVGLRLVGGLMQGFATFVKDNVTWLRPLTTLIVGVIGAFKLWAIAAAALDLVMAANPIVLVGIAIAGIVGGIVYAYTHFKIFRDAVHDVWAALQDAFGWVKSNWPLLLGILTGPFGLAVIAIVKFHTQIFGAIQTAWNAITSFFSGWWGNITSFFSTSLTGVELALSGAWDAVTSTLKTAWNAIASFFTGWWNNEVSGFKTILTTLGKALSDAWDSFTSAIKTAWNAIKNFFTGWWNDELSGTKKILGTIGSALSSAWSGIESTAKTVFGRIKSFFTGFWGDLKAGFRDAISGITTTWDKIENIMKTPVNWVISNVYDKLIVRFWNDIAGPVGLPKLAKLAGGGKLPGYGGGDIVPALLEPGETVVSKEHSKALAPAFRAAGVPGYAAGGIVSDIGGKVSSVWDGITGAIGETFHKVIGSIEHDLREGLALPMKAAGKVINAAASHVPGSSGMADAMKKAPAALWAGATKMVMSTTAGSGAGGTGKYTGHYGAGVSQWRPDVLKVLGMLSEPASLAGQVLYQMESESGGDPNAINLSDCVTLDYVILTKRGWLPHDQVRPGDETIGYNPETGRSEWTQITRVVRYEDAEVWRIGNRHWHADVTPNHRWWSDTVTTGRPESRKARPEFVRTDSFKSGNRLRLAAAADTDGIPCLSLEDVRIIAWLQGDGTVSPYTMKPRICPECAWVPGDYRGRIGDQLANAVAVHRAKKHAVTKDLTQGEFAGYDGRIWQSKPEQIVKLRALLAAVPHTESVRERDVPAHHLPHHVFSLRREFVTDLLKRSQVMETGPEAFVRALSPDQRAAWLDSMIDAEGHRQAVPSAGNRRGGSGEFVRIAQINGPVQEAIKLAVYLEGYRPTFSALNAEQRGFKPSGQVGMARSHIAPSMFNPHEVLERQPVWCVTTELGTWTARGGDALPFLTGNSNAAAGDPSRGLLHSSRRS